MRIDSAWNEGGEQSKISDLYFLEKFKMTKNLVLKESKKDILLPMEPKILELPNLI